MIELVNFCKEYKSFGKSKIACNDINFVAKKNSITGLIGANGAGKTTIIKAICSIHYATSGNVFLFDKNNNKFDAKNDCIKSKSLIGYVPENPVFINNLSVYEYLKFVYEVNFCVQNSRSLKSRNENFDNELKKVIKQFSLESVISQKINTLSKGYKQRVSFASSILSEPEILILDEPASGLDPNQIIELRNLIKKFSQNKTILLSTHIMQEAENLCDNIVIIDNGKLLATGSIEEVKKLAKAKTLEQAYINLTKVHNNAK